MIRLPRRPTVADVSDETGASAAEYGLLAAAIAAVVAVVVFALGGVVQAMFADSCDNIEAEAQTGTECVTDE